MEPLKKPLKLKFKINYGADFGDNINVIGNIKELGEWKFFNSLKLNWNPGNFWVGEITIDREIVKKIEYKYAVIKYDQEQNQNNMQLLRWEEGKNRLIYLNPDCSDISPFEDDWGQQHMINYQIIYLEKQLEQPNLNKVDRVDLLLNQLKILSNANQENQVDFDQKYDQIQEILQKI